MKSLFLTLIPLLAVSGAGFFAGHGAVWLLNHIPDRYMPPAGVRGNDGRQRIASVPWKNVFAASFIAAGLDMVQRGWQYTVAGLFFCFALLLLGVADYQYGEMPQPLLWMLAVTGLGFTPVAAGLIPMLKGMAVGAGVAAVWNGVMVLRHHRIPETEQIAERVRWELAAFGAAAGWSLGVKGILFVFVAGAAAGVIWRAVLLLWKRRYPRRTAPRVPLGTMLCVAAMFDVVVLYQL